MYCPGFVPALSPALSMHVAVPGGFCVIDIWISAIGVRRQFGQRRNEAAFGDEMMTFPVAFFPTGIVGLSG